jgi:hypothetical protein
MTQHPVDPYYIEDLRDLPRWKLNDGKLIHRISSRIPFRTNISKSILESLKDMAKEKNIRVNYLLEIGLQNTLKQEVVSYSKDTRPKDRIQYKTTMIINY